MGLFDFLRGKPDEDPILGNRTQEPTGLEVTPVEDDAQGWTQDPAALIRTLQEAGGDPDKLVAELRELFPDAQIDVQQQTFGGADPARTAQAFFGAAASDPLDQIERLAELHQRGALTARFAAAKAKLLNG